jgi:hypothetical protein
MGLTAEAFGSFVVPAQGDSVCGLRLVGRAARPAERLPAGSMQFSLLVSDRQRISTPPR